jgi:hypothetical protein
MALLPKLGGLAGNGGGLFFDLECLLLSRSSEEVSEFLVFSFSLLDESDTLRFFFEALYDIGKLFRWLRLLPFDRLLCSLLF